MVSCPAGQTGTSAAHSFYDIFIRHIHINGIINLIAKLCQRFIQYISLRNRSRKSIQYISVSAILLCNSVKKNLNRQLIRNKQPLIHIFLRFHAKFRAVLDVCTKNITCGNMGNSIFFSDHFCLRALACAGGAQHNYLHTLLRSLTPVRG